MPAAGGRDTLAAQRWRDPAGRFAPQTRTVSSGGDVSGRGPAGDRALVGGRGAQGHQRAERQRRRSAPRGLAPGAGVQHWRLAGAVSQQLGRRGAGLSLSGLARAGAAGSESKRRGGRAGG